MRKMSHQRLPSRASDDANFQDESGTLRKSQASGSEVAVELTDRSLPTDRQSHDQQDEEQRKAIEEPQLRASSHAHGIVARKRTIVQIVLTFLPRWLVNLAIAMSMYGVLAHYANVTVMSKSSKRGFNAIITGLSIAQGLVIVSSLSGMVRDLRWWILSRRFRSRTKVERILRANSMLELINLARKSKRPSIYVGTLVWLLVILASQVAVASLNLFYSTGVSEVYALMVKGDVRVADVSTIYTDKTIASKSRTLGAQQYTANSYGIVSTAYNIVIGQELVPEPDTIFFPGEPFIYWSSTNNTYLYLFRETSAKSELKSGIWAVAVATSRTVTSFASCKSYPVVAGGNGEQLSLLIEGEGKEEQNVTIPLAGGTDQTTYFTNTTEECGDGCSPITAFESTDQGTWYYKCNVTVEQVVNAIRPEHEISLEVRRLASQGIALQGYGVSSLARNNITQFQSYPLESIFGSSANGSVAEMADLLSRFTTGVIAAVAETNNFVTIPNVNAPEAGVSLTVSHPGLVVLILGGLVVLHLFLEILVAILANRVVVPPKGVVASAHVLRSMTLEETQAWPEKSSMFARKMSKGPDGGRGLWRYRVTPLPEMGRDVYDLSMEKGPQ